MPIIWGQEFYYLYVQLKDYKAGRRENEIMSEVVADLDKPTLRALAEHFAAQRWPTTGYRADAESDALGQSAATSGMCPQCHLGLYQGDSRVPRLAGQQVPYLMRTMVDFKHKRRNNSPAKSSLFAAYKDSQIQDLAEYLGGISIVTD